MIQDFLKLNAGKNIFKRLYFCYDFCLVIFCKISEINIDEKHLY